MKWNVGTKISAGFGLVLVIFVVVGAVSYRSTAALIETTDLRKQTHEILIQIDGALSSLKDVDIGQRGYLFTGEERYLDPYQAAPANIEARLQEIRRLTVDNPRHQRRLDTLEPLVKNRLAVAQEAVDARRANNMEAATQLFKLGRGKVLVDEIRKILGEMQNEENGLFKQRTEAAHSDAENAKWTILLGTLAALALAALTGYTLTRNLSRPLQALTAMAERITVGDLISVKVAIDTRGDEVGVLARTFERMTQSLRAMAGAAEQIAAGDLRSTIEPHSVNDVLGNAFARMSEDLRGQIRELIEGTNVLGSAASEILAVTTQIASGATETATAVTETTATVEEVKQTAQLASQKAKYVSDSAQKASNVSHAGRKSVDETIQGMHRIQEQMESIAESIVRLSEQSHSIGEIIATVNDLAEQSNVLAVNAAIEAAKAGEQGRGFAVVAQEVKSLAEQSKQATTQVRAMLGDIQRATSTAVLATEQGNKAVEAGMKQSTETGESIRLLTESISEASQAATQIAASSQQQMVGMDQVALAMDNIKQASVQNVAGTRQAEAAARQLHELGQRLKHLAVRYKV